MPKQCPQEDQIIVKMLYYIKSILKKIIPARLRFYVKNCYKFDQETRNFLYLRDVKDYSCIKLSEESERAKNIVENRAKEIYADKWNLYSNALRREVLETFEKSICALGKKVQNIDYLEIGSNQGISMSVISTILRARNLPHRLVSIDPYFKNGYTEGAGSPASVPMRLTITKDTKEKALMLYQMCGLNVELIEKTSSNALQQLIRSKRKFNLIYIDGSHEGLNPAFDFGLCSACFDTTTVLIIDDYMWKDIKPLKELCDRHAEKIHECWKIAAYRIK